MKTWWVAAAGAAAALGALWVGRKKPASAAPAPSDGDHIEPPPKRPPYQAKPTDLNPVGGYPGVQHLMVDAGPQLPDPMKGPSVGGRPFYVDRAPETEEEAAALLGAGAPLGGEYPLHVFAGSTAFVRDPSPSNPFARKNVKMILLGGAWIEWAGAGEAAGSPVTFQVGPDGTWRRLTPAGTVHGLGLRVFEWIG